MRLTKRAIISLAAFSFTVGLNAQAENIMEDGMTAFNQKRYYAAEDAFNKALQKDPNNQDLYLLLGKTLEFLRDQRGAKEAYENCFRINPFNTQGATARKSVTELSGRIEADSHQPSDTPEITKKTIDVIHRQVGELKSGYQKQGVDASNWRMQMSTLEAAKLGYDTQNTLRGLRSNYGYGRRGSYSASRSDEQEVSNIFAIRSNYIRTDGQVQALTGRTWGTKAALAAQESANGLETLLAEPKRPGEAKLRALGTTLYTRYYGNEDHEPLAPPPDPLVELKANQVKLQDLPPLPKALSARELTLHDW